MDAKTIGSIISEKRRALGITQEELGGAVGVSTQAVSKWENGGAPDVELLPAIADKLGISVDALFGRDIAPSDAVDAVCAYFSSVKNGDRAQTLFNILWRIQKSYCGLDSDKEDWDEEKAQYRNRYSEMLENDGVSIMCLDPKKPYFALFPEAAGRTEELLEVGVAGYSELFAALSSPDILNAVFYLERRNSKPFTPKIFVRELGVTEEAAQKIVDTLLKLKMLHSDVIELDDEEKTIYSYSYNQYIVPFLTFACNLIRRPGNFSYYCGNRQNPYLMPSASTQK